MPFDANDIPGMPYHTFPGLHALSYADVLLIPGVAGAWMLLGQHFPLTLVLIPAAAIMLTHLLTLAGNIPIPTTNRGKG